MRQFVYSPAKSPVELYAAPQSKSKLFFSIFCDGFSFPPRFSFYIVSIMHEFPLFKIRAFLKKAKENPPPALAFVDLLAPSGSTRANAYSQCVFAYKRLAMSLNPTIVASLLIFSIP